MNRSSMFQTLKHLKGNPKISILTEPLWNVPFNLFIPYAAIFMRALGVTQIQIGYILTLSMISQVIFSLLGGIITDKLGRRKTTFIFDILSWGVPTFIWAISQNYWYFLVAAMINGIWRVTAISWTCLFVEDADDTQLVSLFSWIHITGMMSAFIAPLTGVLINKFTLVPTIRGIYFFACVSMMTKFILLNKYSKETERGKERLIETASESWSSMLLGYKETFKHILTTGKTLYVVFVMILLSIVTTINGSFWGIIVTERLRVDPAYVGLITTLKSFVMMFFYFVVLPHIKVEKFRWPLSIGISMLLSAQLLLVVSSEQAYLLIILSVILEGVSFSLINPLLDSLQVTLVDKNERARIVAVLYTIVILFTAPFGAFAGYLSDIDQRFPFVFNEILLVVGLIVVFTKGALHEEKSI